MEGLMGTAATALLRQQGVMREATALQVKVEDTMTEMAKVLEEGQEL